MKILTFNTWQERGPWRERWELILRETQALQPDLVGFQEVFNRDWAEEVQKRLDFPHMVFPAEPSGLIFLSRFPVIQWECLTMKTQSPTENYFRYALFAKLKVRNQELAVFNTHLSWRLEEGAIRQKQAGELLVFMDQKAQKTETVVMGDFNSTADTPEIRKMIRAGNCVDTFQSLYPKDAGLTWDNRNPYTAGSDPRMPERRIDYIFIRNTADILSGLKSVRLVMNQPSNEGVWPSDHVGLLAVFDE